MEQEQAISQSFPESTIIQENINQTSQPFGTEHLDELIADFEEVEVKQEIEKRAASLMNKEEFKALFFGAGNVCHVWLKYDTLLTLAPDNPQAVEAIEALYDCIYDIPQLHWLLKPGNIWFQRAFSIGFFFVPFALGIRNDIKAKRQSQSRPVIPQPKQKDHIVVNFDDFSRGVQ